MVEPPQDSKTELERRMAKDMPRMPSMWSFGITLGTTILSYFAKRSYFKKELFRMK
jgi:hypothetical protein